MKYLQANKDNILTMLTVKSNLTSQINTKICKEMDFKFSLKLEEALRNNLIRILQYKIHHNLSRFL